VSLRPANTTSVTLLGIDIGGSGIKGAPIDVVSGRLVAERYRVKTPAPATPEAVAKAVQELTRHFSWTDPLGIAFPARIKSGVATTASNIDPSWIGCNAALLFEEYTGCPAFVMNDADAAGAAEMAYGAGKGAGGLVLMLTFGTGIGTALFYDGILIPNAEFGHLELSTGKAEHYASDRARKKDDLSWSEWAKRVQKYLAHLEFILAPDLIIVGGGVSKPHKAERFIPLLETKAPLVTAHLQNEAGIVGAAYSAARLFAPVR
jgi:polyphosphate glucokinase